MAAATTPTPATIVSVDTDGIISRESISSLGGEIIQGGKTKGEGVEGYTRAAGVAGEGKGILCIQSESRSLCSGLLPP